uniref:Uncharacterized protein n=1 Tax=uncultured prokaryote TaxID=198431 RepID=A0A0H5Q6E0_9ZZZZ|nr:hypothetical protein [uncultured prokaryote]
MLFALSACAPAPSLRSPMNYSDCITIHLEISSCSTPDCNAVTWQQGGVPAAKALAAAGSSPCWKTKK